MVISISYFYSEINIIIRLWMVIGLIGGAHGHFMDLIQVIKGDKKLFLENATKIQHILGITLLGFPSLLGIYAMVYLYIINISLWSIESYILVILVCFTLIYDLYSTMGWGVDFFWHKNHVLAHCVFLISEYTATGRIFSKIVSFFPQIIFTRIYLFLQVIIYLKA